MSLEGDHSAFTQLIIRRYQYKSDHSRIPLYVDHLCFLQFSAQQLWVGLVGRDSTLRRHLSGQHDLLPEPSEHWFSPDCNAHHEVHSSDS